MAEIPVQETSTLIQFLTQGKLGPLEIGLTRKDVRLVLGDPEDWPVGEDKRSASIWKYEDLELSFVNDELLGIWIEFHDRLQLPEALGIQGYFPNASTSRQQIMEFVERHKLEYQVDEQLTFDSQTCYIFASSHIRVIFYTDKPQRIAYIGT